MTGVGVGVAPGVGVAVGVAVGVGVGDAEPNAPATTFAPEALRTATVVPEVTAGTA
jgi:hypothetical protein